MASKKQLSIEEIQELLDVATIELLNFFIRDGVISSDNPTAKYTLEDDHSFVEVNVTAKTEKGNKTKTANDELTEIQIIKNQIKIISEKSPGEIKKCLTQIRKAADKLEPGLSSKIEKANDVLKKFKQFK